MSMFKACDFSRCATSLAVVCGILTAVYSLFIRPKRIKRFSPTGRLVVITGCDSGFGRSAAFSFARQGYRVVALCLTAEGVESLQRELKADETDALHPLQCDVTVDDQIQSVVRHCSSIIERSQGALRMWALINNAGIAPCGFVDWLSMRSVRATMEVNYFAVVSVTKAFLPLLKTTRESRIINVSSAAGFAGFHGGGAYCGMCLSDLRLCLAN